MSETGSDATVAGSTRPPIGTIKVRITVDENNKCWNYAIEADDQPSIPYVLAGNKIDVPTGPTTTIEFKIQGPLAGQFDFDENDPIWVSDQGCPQSYSSNPSVEIKSCKNNKLEISDLNLDKIDLYYRLNFIDKNKVHHYWDPIIRNGGGGP